MVNKITELDEAAMTWLQTTLQTVQKKTGIRPSHWTLALVLTTLVLAPLRENWIWIASAVVQMVITVAMFTGDDGLVKTGLKFSGSPVMAISRALLIAVTAAAAVVPPFDVRQIVFWTATMVLTLTRDCYDYGSSGESTWKAMWKR